MTTMTLLGADGSEELGFQHRIAHLSAATNRMRKRVNQDEELSSQGS
jgi:hypothetical protein